MDRTQRRKRYTAIERYRKRPLIVYATSTRQNVQAMMAGDSVREFIDQVMALPSGDCVDVLIHSYGGDALVAWKLMSVLREARKHVSVLVPSTAMSAATILALGADEIVMHPYASLGPIDPQIQGMGPDGKPIQFAYEDVGAFLRFLEQEVGISEQVHISTILEKLFTVANPLTVGIAKRASELASEVGGRMLSMHMTKPEEEPRARQIAESLNRSFFNHGDHVSRSRARVLGLKVAPDDLELESLLWNAFVGIESYMELRAPFQPLQLFMKDQEAAASLRPPGPLQLPQNTPPNLLNQVWPTIVNQALQQIGRAPAVPFSIVHALVESARIGSEFRTSGTVSAVRVGLDIKVSVETTAGGAWMRSGSGVAQEPRQESMTPAAVKRTPPVATSEGEHQGTTPEGGS